MNTKVLLKGPPPPRGEPIKYRRWGEGLEEEAVMQMDRAWAQLGTSGSGNHFVEFGLFTAHEAIRGLERGHIKDIHQVMAAQSDLVAILGQFDPKLVKMAPAGERPED